MEKITARNNDKIKYACSLAASASKRRESGEFLLEGARLCADAALSGVETVRAFFTADAVADYAEYVSAVEGVCGECYEISSEVALKLSDTGNASQMPIPSTNLGISIKAGTMKITLLRAENRVADFARSMLCR